MEQDNSYDEATLTNAGASLLFVEYYDEAPTGASARREVESGPFTLDELNQSPSLGGGFFEALWEGDTTQAIRRADSSNARILESVTGMKREDTF
jgi:hypothetical protein